MDRQVASQRFKINILFTVRPEPFSKFPDLAGLVGSRAKLWKKPFRVNAICCGLKWNK
jgi:hypothetical protein